MRRSTRRFFFARLSNFFEPQHFRAMATIHLIRTTAAPEQIRDMPQAFDEFIKLAVDIELEILAGGGSMHADCEELLCNDHS